MTKQDIINQKPLPLPPEIIAQLTAPIDPAATKEVGTKGGFTSIKAYYIIERLNTVFGVHGWTHTCEVVYSNDKDLAVKGKLILWDYGIVIEEMGGSNDRDVADRFKGAKTSSFSKATSILGVGREIYAQGYSGKQRTQQNQPTKPKPKKPQYNIDDPKKVRKVIDKVRRDGGGDIKWYGRGKNILYCNQYQYNLSPEMVELAKNSI
jgi:hypothetical protein